MRKGVLEESENPVKDEQEDNNRAQESAALSMVEQPTQRDRWSGSYGMCYCNISDLDILTGYLGRHESVHRHPGLQASAMPVGVSASVRVSIE